MPTGALDEHNLIASGEDHHVVMERAYSPGISPPRRLCVVCHGAGQTPVGAANTVLEGERLAVGLAERGFVVLSLLVLSTTNFGAPAAIERLGDAYDWAITNLGVKDDGLCGVGYSMGNITFLNWALQNLSLVRRYAGCISALNLQQIHDDNVLGSGPFIDTAYAGYPGGLAAAYLTHSPYVYKASMEGLEHRFWYSGNDTATLSTYILDYAAATHSEAINFGDAGHSVTGLPYDDVADYLSDGI